MLAVSTINQHTSDDFARNVATNIKTLMRLRGITAKEGFAQLHVSRGTWFSHMNTGAWSARQMAQLAEMLEVPIEVLYGSPEDLLRIGSIATPLEVIAGGGEASPRPKRHLVAVPS